MNDMQKCHENTNQKRLKNIVFIDANITDAWELIQEIVPKTEIIVIDNQTNGIDCITQVLQSDNYDQVHIISHGAPGCLYLGNSQLSLDNLDNYQTQLQNWFDFPLIKGRHRVAEVSEGLSLEDGLWRESNSRPCKPLVSSRVYKPRSVVATAVGRGDLLLYGCNVAAGDAGAEFISRLQQLTGANIAASSSLTGNSTLGGNWNLEVTTADRDWALVVTENGQKTYAGVLATFRVNTVEDSSDNSDSDLTLREAIVAANQTEGADLIQFAASLENSTIELQEGSLNIRDSVTIRGENNITIDGGDLSGVFNIDNGREQDVINVSLDGLTITGGDNAESGGGIVNAEHLQLSNSSLQDNAAAVDGGAIANTGILTVINSTLSNNNAQSGGGLANSGTAKLVNTTISGNSAIVNGGGIDNNLGTLTVNNSTITDNSAASGSGINSIDGVRVTLNSSILAVNDGNDDIIANSPIVSGGHNLIGNRDNANGFVASDLVGSRFDVLNPGLDVLHDNGGMVATHRLLSGSPAIDAGSNHDGLTVDARGEGFKRAVSGLVDIGAFEVQSLNLEGTVDEDTLVGGGAADKISGLEANDILSGNGSNDYLNGGDGDDTLSGSIGADILDGSLGNDFIDGGDGYDLLIGNAGDDRLIAGFGNDTLVGHDGNDNLTGGDGDDYLLGVVGEDILSSGLGDDTLLGGIGNDSITGGDGDDLLYGGVGRDSLVGGAGADIFALEFIESQNIIQDFENGVDRIAFLTHSMTFGSLTLVDTDSGDVSIEDRTGNVLAIVENMTAANLTSDDFITL
jgi:CSLREA domain-containing protein